MSKVTNGQRLVCVPCGREVIIDECGCSEDTLWCCGKPMASKAKKISKKKGKK